ncbi:MAG: M42 family metallopeptidase [Candidatus Eisenbacteria bacterium]|uniref:M42 family metallopeptidase n=1 Tax=Eiseniibacteriota bacterium TaxID=2212470 RepID=A0A948W6R7_UNCEI|nr:M42 family metallopeptidase [Candidatus Eisenbacteria bacterium]MBU1950539.1 M42 family metallopeptidase [Candidatus Eisenbacteria bacterium]MBU2690926.1 M42 family metallopeptidase [Candidatus Eisenbacteria bacterium]
MQASSLSFLEKLLESPGPSGSEGPVQSVFEAYVRPYADEIIHSPHGSVAAIRNPKGKPRVILTGHADEIGLIVHHIDKDGFLFFRTIGGIDPVTLPATRVEVHTQKGMILGVIGRRPMHLLQGDERNKVGKIQDLYIDIGASTKSEAEKLVRAGDPVTFRRGLLKLGKQRVTSKALDNRAGVFCAAEAFRLLGRTQPKACVIALSTVGEEIGGDGAFTASFELKPDLAIAVDVTFAIDQPDVTEKDTTNIHLGRGPVIQRGPRINSSISRLLEKAAAQGRIKLQFEVEGGRTGTDGDEIYKTRGGVPLGVVTVPCRYMHTPGEIVSLDDLEAISKLLAAFVKGLGPRTSLSPF